MVPSLSTSLVASTVDFREAASVLIQTIGKSQRHVSSMNIVQHVDSVCCCLHSDIEHAIGASLLLFLVE